MNAYMNHYQNNSILTASKEQILIMLYDGAIRFVRQAKQAMVDRSQADKVYAIGKAMAIVTEFSNTLDYEVGGEVAQDLGRLYDFAIRELAAANAHNNAESLEPVEKVLLDLREGFSGAIEANQRSNNAVPQQAAEGQAAENRTAVAG